MPQMSPLSWLTLFIMFTLMLMLFMIVNFSSYSLIPPTCITKNQLMIKPLDWKW